ncbi:hypothetical protein A6R68_01212, partial [Neotoma lepida]
ESVEGHRTRCFGRNCHGCAPLQPPGSVLSLNAIMKLGVPQNTLMVQTLLRTIQSISNQSDVQLRWQRTGHIQKHRSWLLDLADVPGPL